MPAAPDDERWVPTIVVLAAEHGGAFLWDHSPGRPVSSYAVDPAQLGVSPGLVDRLTAWNAAMERHASRWNWNPPPAELAADDRREWAEWTRQGLHLAYDLQHELDALGSGISVRYREDGEDRDVADRRGP